MLWKPHVAIEILLSEPDRETGLLMKHNRPLFGRIECLGALYVGAPLPAPSWLQVASYAWRAF